MLILEQQAKTEEVKNRINSQNKEGKCKSMLACFKKCKSLFMCKNWRDWSPARLREGQISPIRNLKWNIKPNIAKVYKGTEYIMCNLMQINLKLYFSILT